PRRRHHLADAALLELLVEGALAAPGHVGWAAGELPSCDGTFPTAPLRTGLAPFGASGSPVSHSERWSVVAACMNVLVAFLADHQGLPFSGRHALFPARLRSSSRSVDVCQFANVVNRPWDLLRIPSLACSGQQ